jgi:hypothetical protein
MYGILADDIPWRDADGRETFSYEDACALAGVLEHLGYATEIVRVCRQPAHI